MQKVSSVDVTDEERSVIRNFLKCANRITLIGHENPDHDCMFSMLAIYIVLKKIYKKDVEIVYEGHIPEDIERYWNRECLNSYRKDVLSYDYPYHDLLIIIDATGTYRSNNQSKSINLEKFGAVIRVDHHVNTVNKYEDRFVKFLLQRETASCAELAFEVFAQEIEKLSEKETENVCEMLFYAVLEDSKFFFNQQVGLRTLETATQIAKLGNINIREIVSQIQSRPFKYFQKYADYIRKIKEHPAGFRYIFFEPQKDIREAIFLDDVKNHFKNDMQKVIDGDVFVFFQRFEKSQCGWFYKVRIRSRNTDLMKFCRMLSKNGGGHSNAGGAVIEAQNDKDALRVVAEKFRRFRRSEYVN